MDTCVDCTKEVAPADVVILKFKDTRHFEFCVPCADKKLGTITSGQFTTIKRYGGRILYEWTGMSEISFPDDGKPKI